MYRWFSEKEVSGLKSNLPEILDKTRDLLGRPIIITFTTGGIHCSHSAHYEGLAADLGTGHLADGFVRHNYVFNLIEAFFKIGGLTCIEVCPSHVHVDIAKSPEYPRPVFLIGGEA